MDRLELLERILKARGLNIQKLIELLKDNGMPTAYRMALYKNSGETEEYYRQIERVLNLKEGTLYDESRAGKSTAIAQNKENNSNK